MNSNVNVQLNEDYRFRIAYVREILREMFGTSKVVDDTKLDNRIKDIEKAQDNYYMQNLEKEMTDFISNKESKDKNSKFNTENMKDNIQTREVKKQVNELQLEELEENEL